jgi:hypothetical protein
MIDVLALAAFTVGTEPHAAAAQLDEVRGDAALVPPGATVLRTARGHHCEAVLAAGPGWTIRVVLWKSGGAAVDVTAETAELAGEVLDLALKDSAPDPSPDDGTVSIGFWHQSGRRGPVRTARPVEAAPWPVIEGNYPAAVRSALADLVALTAAGIDGRLLLLHGVPGTGKSTFLRALAREWRDWCQADCVLDPERLFEDPGYLLDVILGHESDAADARRWRLLILEDCDELIRGEAKQHAGQALSRLLNLTDGILGQGRKVLIAITTNEDLHRLHPAVTRPGRCLAQVEMRPFPPAEASWWLRGAGGAGSFSGPVTLAELYALCAGRRTMAKVGQPHDETGLYL